MTVASVIDANCMKYFQEERVKKGEGRFCDVIDVALNNGIIAIDDKGLAQQEYFDCCRPAPVGLNLCDWISDQIIAQKIKMFAVNRSAEISLIGFGVPRKDHKWVAIALGAGAFAVVTEDIDLFDPKEKYANEARKAKIKAEGGCVSRHLRRKYKLLVLTGETFLEYFAAP